MSKKILTAMAMMVTMVLGIVVFESTSFAQNTNSSTTNNTMSGSMNGKHMARRHRRHRRARRHYRRGKMKHDGMKTKNANQ